MTIILVAVFAFIAGVVTMALAVLLIEKQGG